MGNLQEVFPVHACFLTEAVCVLDDVAEGEVQAALWPLSDQLKGLHPGLGIVFAIGRPDVGMQLIDVGMLSKVALVHAVFRG